MLYKLKIKIKNLKAKQISLKSILVIKLLNTQSLKHFSILHSLTPMLAVILSNSVTFFVNLPILPLVITLLNSFSTLSNALSYQLKTIGSFDKLLWFLKNDKYKGKSKACKKGNIIRDGEVCIYYFIDKIFIIHHFWVIEGKFLQLPCLLHA